MITITILIIDKNDNIPDSEDDNKDNCNNNGDDNHDDRNSKNANHDINDSVQSLGINRWLNDIIGLIIFPVYSENNGFGLQQTFFVTTNVATPETSSTFLNIIWSACDILLILLLWSNSYNSGLFTRPLISALFPSIRGRARSPMIFSKSF